MKDVFLFLSLSFFLCVCLSSSLYRVRSPSHASLSLCIDYTAALSELLAAMGITLLSCFEELEQKHDDGCKESAVAMSMVNDLLRVRNSENVAILGVLEQTAALSPSLSCFLSLSFSLSLLSLLSLCVCVCVCGCCVWVRLGAFVSSRVCVLTQVFGVGCTPLLRVPERFLRF